jgi:hypothetical protein
MLAFGMLANSKGQIVAPFLYIGLCVWGASGKFPVKLTLASLLLYVLVAFPFVTASRVDFQPGDLQGTRQDFTEAMIEYLISHPWFAYSLLSDGIQSLGRGLLTYFAQIVQQTGTAVDFMHGRTLSQAFDLLLPRFLAPEKPDMNIGNWTAQMYGVIAPSDDATNMSPSYMGEFYMNFGLGGVLAGMFLVGALATLVDQYLIISKQSWTMPVMVAYVGWQESVVGHTIVPFVKNACLWVPVLLLICYFFTRPHDIRHLRTSAKSSVHGVT